MAPQQCVTASFSNLGWVFLWETQSSEHSFPLTEKMEAKRLSCGVLLSVSAKRTAPTTSSRSFLALQSPSQASFLCDFHFPRGPSLLPPLPFLCGCSPLSNLASLSPTVREKAEPGGFFGPPLWRLHLNAHRSGESSLAVTGIGV